MKKDYIQRMSSINRELKEFLNKKDRRERFTKKKPTDAISNDGDSVPNRKLLNSNERNKLSDVLKHFLALKQKYPFEKSYDVPNGIIAVPRVLSLYKSPDETKLFILQLFYLLYEANHKVVKIDYINCEEITLDASLIVDIILSEFIGHFKKFGKIKGKRRIEKIRSLNIGNDDVRKFIFATGTSKIIKNTEINYPDIITYQLCKGDKRKGSGSKEIEITNLIDYVIACTNRLNKRLPFGYIQELSELVGEVLNNAEDHSTTPFRYSIGHFQEFDKRGHSGRFQFCILNLGKSIYEILIDPNLCQNKEIIKEMKRLSGSYTQKKWFGLGRKFDEEILWSLYSLQDGVSSISSHRGNGTIRFIESFLKLKDVESNASRMFIYSGHSVVEFDGEYVTKTINKVNGDSHQIITFNKSNTLLEPPDIKYVRKSDFYFPGTLIYADIYISELESSRDLT